MPFLYGLATRPLGRTTIHVFVAPNGGPYIGNLAITAVVSARCYVNVSAADPDRTSAHLCVGKSGKMFDPCFRMVHYPSAEKIADLVCYASPWASRYVAPQKPITTSTTIASKTYVSIARFPSGNFVAGVGIKLTQWMKGTSKPASGGLHPWALELRNHLRCVATRHIADYPEDATYVCRPKESQQTSGKTSFATVAGWIIGYPKLRDNGVWYASFERRDSTSALPTAIAESWE